MNDVIVGVVSTMLLAGVTQGVRFVNAYINSHFRPTQLAALADVARTAVQAAQEFGAPKDFSGDQKLEYAQAAVIAGAKKVGLKLTDDEVSSFVHAALREMKHVAALTMPQAA